MRNTVYATSLLAILILAACSKSEAPAPQSTAAPDTHPVKNVGALPSGTIQEGAKTMNSAADLSKAMEQQKQDREKDAESQTK